jgi:hypothetical protein
MNPKTVTPRVIAATQPDQDINSKNYGSDKSGLPKPIPAEQQQDNAKADCAKGVCQVDWKPGK